MRLLILLTTSLLIFLSCTSEKKEFIRFNINGEKIEIYSAGLVDTISDDKCNSLFIQHISTDTINFKKPLVDFGIELTCGRTFSENEIIELVKDTITFPKEFYEDDFNFTPSFLEHHKPWPKLMYVFDGRRDRTSYGNYAKGFVKFSKIEKVSPHRYRCEGTFDFTYRYPGNNEITRIENGEFNLVMNLI